MSDSQQAVVRGGCHGVGVISVAAQTSIHEPQCSYHYLFMHYILIIVLKYSWLFQTWIYIYFSSVITVEIIIISFCIYSLSTLFNNTTLYLVKCLYHFVLSKVLVCLCFKGCVGVQHCPSRELGCTLCFLWRHKIKSYGVRRVDLGLAPQVVLALTRSLFTEGHAWKTSPGWRPGGCGGAGTLLWAPPFVVGQTSYPISNRKELILT